MRRVQARWSGARRVRSDDSETVIQEEAEVAEIEMLRFSQGWIGSGQTEGITRTAQDAQFAEKEGKIEMALT